MWILNSMDCKSTNLVWNDGIKNFWNQLGSYVASCSLSELVFQLPAWLSQVEWLASHYACKQCICIPRVLCCSYLHKDLFPHFLNLLYFRMWAFSNCELVDTLFQLLLSSFASSWWLPPALHLHKCLTEEIFDWFHHDRQKNQSWIYYFPALVRASPRYSRRYLLTQIWKAYNVELRTENDVQCPTAYDIYNSKSMDSM